MVKVALIIASVRNNRFGEQPATWVVEKIKQRHDVELDVIDLKEVNLPHFHDDPTTSDVIDKWNERLQDVDGYIFVTPEYNHAIPASLKDALDHAYDPWNYRPMVAVSYGFDAGGARAVEQLRDVAAELRMFGLRDAIHIVNYPKFLDDKGTFQPSQGMDKTADTMLDELIFWANALKQPRQERLKNSE